MKPVSGVRTHPSNPPSRFMAFEASVGACASGLDGCLRFVRRRVLGGWPGAGDVSCLELQTWSWHDVGGLFVIKEVRM